MEDSAERMLVLVMIPVRSLGSWKCLISYVGSARTSMGRVILTMCERD